VLAERISLGQLVGFMFYLGLFYEPITRLHGLNQMLQAARAAGERVFDILDATIERSDGLARKQLRTPVCGEVVYETVCFGYNSERQVLKNISLQARPGELIALAGPTGAGKSTLVNLLPAFYEISFGRITIDGQDTRNITLESLRSQISIVSQEPFLFNGTIRENILFGRIDASEKEVVAASRAANCHEFIVRLPNGYDSRVGERGVKLSVGEKQRVSIARALLKNAPILILDEATASVDTGTERLIQEALGRLMAGRTSFVIAHRLSTIRKADQILVMRHGEIAERGTHEELVALGGIYSKLARIQGAASLEERFEMVEG
jgi:ATP-binding cassette subfamily B protein